MDKYELLRVPFGQVNAPVVFHWVIDMMLDGMQNEYIPIYMDDPRVPLATVQSRTVH